MSAVIINGALAMDVGVLCRLFRSFGKTHATTKIVYVGDDHASRYIDFIENVMGYPIKMKIENNGSAEITNFVRADGIELSRLIGK